MPADATVRRALRRRAGTYAPLGNVAASYLAAVDVPVIWASRAATAERRLAGITFA